MTAYGIPEIVLKELASINAPWRIEPGTKHGKLIVNGEFCGIVKRGRADQPGRFAQNLRAQVRRAAAGRNDRKERQS